MSCIALIPARAGSKGLPGKNSALIDGKTLVQRAIETALSISLITRIVITTDDEEVRAIGESFGVEIVHRPNELAQDDSPIEAAMLHALETVHIDFESTPVMTLLQPTSPLRDSKVLENALRTFIINGARGAIFGVVDVEHHPSKMLRIDGDCLVPLTSVADLSASRQSLASVVRQSGSIYVTSVVQFLQRHSLFIEPVRWIKVDEAEAIDIDSLEELERARDFAHRLNR